MASRTADHRVAVPVVTDRWSSVTFVHWRCPAEILQARLPPGLAVDEYDGSAWLSITPFVMARIRPLGRLALPVPPGVRSPPLPEGLQRLTEIRGTNLRTYVRGPDGEDGLWFLSQDTSNLAFALGARTLLGAPYHWGRLAVENRGDRLAYSGSRFRSRVRYVLTVRPGEPIEPAERDTWLTGRWRAYTHRAGRLLVTPVEHEPWPLRTATLQRIEQTLTEAVGVPAPTDTLVHFSDGVQHVRTGFTRPH